MYERILYVSRAAPATTGAAGRDALYAIIRAAHARNAADGVTGALVFIDGWFAQLLEGPAAATAACWERVRVDPRHGAVGLRLRERGLARLFPGQPMALRTAACLPPRLSEAFGYRPGFPAEALPADALVEFLVRACRTGGAAAGAGARAGRLDKARRAF